MVLLCDVVLCGCGLVWFVLVCCVLFRAIPLVVMSCCVFRCGFCCCDGMRVFVLLCVVVLVGCVGVVGVFVV